MGKKKKINCCCCCDAHSVSQCVCMGTPACDQQLSVTFLLRSHLVREGVGGVAVGGATQVPGEREREGEQEAGLRPGDLEDAVLGRRPPAASACSS